MTALSALPCTLVLLYPCPEWTGLLFQDTEEEPRQIGPGWLPDPGVSLGWQILFCPQELLPRLKFHRGPGALSFSLTGTQGLTNSRKPPPHPGLGGGGTGKAYLPNLTGAPFLYVPRAQNCGCLGRSVWSTGRETKGNQIISGELVGSGTP